VASVQTKCATCESPAAGDSAATIHDAAAAVHDRATPELPHRERIQHAFGRHDVSSVRSATGGIARDASDRMGAAAFTSGNTIGFREQPDLRLAAHESAHVVQQRAGLSLPGGVGRPDDPWERHADRVADTVVAGGSAEPVLDEVAGGGCTDRAPVQRAPIVQRQPAGAGVKEEHHDTETKEEFAKRVYARAADRLQKNIGVLDQWSEYIKAMDAFQIRAQMFTTKIADHAITAKNSPLHQEYFEREMGTERPEERAFFGAMNDPDATYKETADAMVSMIIANSYTGSTTSPSVADQAQVIAGQRSEDSLAASHHVGTKPGYEFYRDIAKKIAEGKAGGCETCHEINRAWGLTVEKYGTPLPRDDWFEGDRFGNKLPTTSVFSRKKGFPGASLSDDQLATLTQWIKAEGGSGKTTQAPVTAPTPAVNPPALFGDSGAASVAAGADVASTSTSSTAFAPFIPVPKGVEIPPPRTDLCGDLPDAADSDRKLDIASWGPSSAIVANVIETVNAVLLPLGPRGYRVLPRQTFDDLYRASPSGLEGLREDILTRIKKKQDGYASLRTEALSDDPPPYAEFCPIVDELLPTTSFLAAYQATEDVHAWQRKERALQILELTLLALSIIYPPASLITIPTTMALGLVRIGLGIDQRRQGRQWTLGSGAGVYSMQQEAEAPGLAARGRNNIIAGIFEFGLSAFSFARIIQQVRAQQAFARLLQQMEFGSVTITSPLYPTQILRAEGGRIMLIDTQTQMILGYGTIKNGQIAWQYLRIPFPSAGGGLVPYGQSPLVPFGPGGMVPFGPGAGPIVPYAPGAPGLVAPTVPMLFGPVRPPLLLGPPSSWVPPTWNPSPEFNALAPYQLPPVSSPNAPAVWVRRPDGTWALEFAPGAGTGTNLITWGSGPGASFVIQVPDQSVTALVTPRTGGTYQGARSYPMTQADMTDPATNVVGARSHLVPHADTPVGPVLSTTQPEDYVDHLSEIYNERIRRTLEQRFRRAGHQWSAYNVMSSPPRVSVGGYPIPEAEVIIELGPQGPIKAWRFPNDPAVYQSLPADFDTAISPFEIPLDQVPRTPVR
jgi:hypothetical protein